MDLPDRQGEERSKITRAKFLSERMGGTVWGPTGSRVIVKNAPINRGQPPLATCNTNSGIAINPSP